MNNDWEGWLSDDDPRRRDPEAGRYKQVRVYFPQNCLLSHKMIWPFQMAWRKQYIEHYSKKVAFTHWISNEEMIFAKIKGKNFDF